MEKEDLNNCTQNIAEYTKTGKLKMKKIFECPVCKKIFRYKSDITAHMVLHSDETPYTCPICGRGFKWKGGWTRHLRMHNGERPHICSYCNKSFSTKQNLSNHINVHTGDRPFVCGFCGKAFSDRSNCSAHTQIHKGERPYSCSLCNLTFAYRSDLNEHLRTHIDTTNLDNVEYISGSITNSTDGLFSCVVSVPKPHETDDMAQQSPSVACSGVRTYDSDNVVSESDDPSVHSVQSPFIVNIKIEEDLM